MAGRAVGNRRPPQWSVLQLGLLEMILEKLDFVAHARFASVCSSWRSAATHNPPINKPLYFALSHDPVHLVRRFITSFIPSWRKARFIGAGLDGWLVIAIDGRDLFLLNEGFNSIIPLPAPPINPGTNCKAVLSSPPSSGECTVVIKNLYAGVFYCRLGSDNSFTKLSDIPYCPEDILFYKGRLYVLCDCAPNTIIIFFDHLLNKVSQLVTHSTTFSNTRRLLILGNDILSIVSVGAIQFSVHALEEGSEPRPVQVNDIGDNFQILLSNHYCSLSTTTKEHEEFRRDFNCFKNDSGNFVLDMTKDPNQDFRRSIKCFKIDSCNFVLDTSKDLDRAIADDPWPLFFVMFSYRGIRNLVKYEPNVVW